MVNWKAIKTLNRWCLFFVLQKIQFISLKKQWTNLILLHFRARKGGLILFYKVWINQVLLWNIFIESCLPVLRLFGYQEVFLNFRVLIPLFVGLRASAISTKIFKYVKNQKINFNRGQVELCGVKISRQKLCDCFLGDWFDK